MSTVRPSGAGDEAVGTGEKKDGGTIISAGNKASDSPITKDLSIDTIADDFGGTIGSTVVANDGTGSIYTDKAGVQKALSAGTLAYNSTATQWVMAGGNVTTTLSNVANTFLTTAASDSNGANAGRSMTNSLQTTRNLGTMTLDTLAVPTSGIHNYRTFSVAGGTEKNYVRPSGAGNQNSNDESIGTLAVPGELTYMFGGKNPKQDDYKAKNTFES